MRIGIDLMGGDNSPYALFDALLYARELLDSSDTLVVIATHSVINEIKRTPRDLSQVEFHPVLDSISTSDDPLAALKSKKSSSIVVGIRLLKKSYIHAFVSAGNSGALIASATLQLKRQPGVKRPALLALLPTIKGSVAILDIGGSVSCRTEHLVQFAYMGAAFQRCYQGIAKPTVALLNIGVEAQKGNSVVREAYQILSSNQTNFPTQMNFVGNVEGRDIFRGEVDVVVTDGFTGNVLLKTSEGVSSFIFDQMQEILKKESSPTLLAGLQELKRDFSYDEYPGAIVCGVEGLVVKCHGGASPLGFLNGIRGAITLVRCKRQAI